MVRFERVIRIFTVLLLSMLVVTGTIYADFGYGDVYWLDEETGQWIKDIDGEWAAIVKKGDGYTFLGNIGGSASFSGSVIADLDKPATSTISSFALNADGAANSYEYISSDGIFSLKVTALSFENKSMIDVIWDPVKQQFLLVHDRTVAKWQFTYKICNNLAVGMDVLLVQDNFGDELVVEGIQIVTPPGSHDTLETGKPGPNGFQWKNIRLEPGQTAQITFTLATGKNPGGKQQYGCGLHYLNSLGVLKYRYDGQPGKGQKSIDGWSFPVQVCGDAAISAHFELSSTGVEWYIRKPGDYFAKLLNGAVRVVEAPNREIVIGVSFSGFNDLVSDGGQEIPVWYSLVDEEQAAEVWTRSRELNGIKLELKASANKDASFSMWQRIVLETQSPGLYENLGVVSFSLVNSQPILCD